MIECRKIKRNVGVKAAVNIKCTHSGRKGDTRSEKGAEK